MSPQPLPKCRNCLTNQSVQLLTPGQYPLYWCDQCQIGFIAPLPTNMDQFYPPTYWQNPGQFAKLRHQLHLRWQQTRVNYLKPFLTHGQILDVGAGEGDFGRLLGANFKVTNLDYPTAQVKNPHIVKADFLTWKTNQKFDGITFLESLEHVPSPQAYLAKAASLLKPGGYIFIEVPGFMSLESRWLKAAWLPRDLPRHFSHFSPAGLRLLGQRVGLKTVQQTGVLSYEYAPYILTASVLTALKLPPLNLSQLSINNLRTLLFCLIFLPLSVIAETIFYLIGQSPTHLTILQKSELLT